MRSLSLMIIHISVLSIHTLLGHWPYWTLIEESILSLTSNQDHCQRFSPSYISETPNHDLHLGRASVLTLFSYLLNFIMSYYCFPETLLHAQSGRRHCDQYSEASFSIISNSRKRISVSIPNKYYEVISLFFLFQLNYCLQYSQLS